MNHGILRPPELKSMLLHHSNKELEPINAACVEAIIIGCHPLPQELLHTLPILIGKVKVILIDGLHNCGEMNGIEEFLRCIEVELGIWTSLMHFIINCSSQHMHSLPCHPHYK